ncbi:MAG: hemerythrin domain-containing protein [Magnetococcus sp. YQC-5]
MYTLNAAIVQLLSNQHRLIERTLDEISRLTTFKPNPEITVLLANRITLLYDQLSSHLEDEDRLIFGFLIASPNSYDDIDHKFHPWSQESVLKVGVLASDFYKTWRFADVILSRWDDFVSNAEELLELIENRMHTEEASVFCDILNKKNIGSFGNCTTDLESNSCEENYLIINSLFPFEDYSEKESGAGVSECWVSTIDEQENFEKISDHDLWD